MDLKLILKVQVQVQALADLLVLPPAVAKIPLSRRGPLKHLTVVILGQLARLPPSITIRRHLVPLLRTVLPHYPMEIPVPLQHRADDFKTQQR